MQPRERLKIPVLNFKERRKKLIIIIITDKMQFVPVALVSKIRIGSFYCSKIPLQ